MIKRKEQESKIRENSLGDSGSRRDLITLAPGWPWVAPSYSITSLPWTTIPCLFNQRDHTRLDHTKLYHTEADHRCHIIDFCWDLWYRVAEWNKVWSRLSAYFQTFFRLLIRILTIFGKKYHIITCCDKREWLSVTPTLASLFFY